MFSRTCAIIATLSVISQAHAFEFSYKGMIKAEYVHTDAATASFGGTYSQVAPTHALRTDTFGGAPATVQQANFLDSAAGSFQVSQSRFSLNMSHEKVRGVLEMDFIDGADGFTNQTALQAQGPRLRLATIYYSANDNWTLFAGQKWSTASGIKGVGSYNWVGNLYRAGNTGFLAVEAGATYRNEGFTITGALTGRGRNNSAVGVNANELGGTPGLAVDANYKFNGHMVGVAGHVATVNFSDEPGYVSGGDQDANLFKIFGSFKFNDITINAEIYTGESLNNQNALGIAPATSLGAGGVVRESFSESGYFAFASWNVRPGHNIKAGFGSAEVDSGDRGRLGLTDLSKNTGIYANYGVKLFDGLTAFGQLTHFDTEFGVDGADFQTIETRIGAVFKF